MGDEKKVVRHADGGRVAVPPKAPEPKTDSPAPVRVDRYG